VVTVPAWGTFDLSPDEKGCSFSHSTSWTALARKTQTGLRRLGTDGSQTPRRREMDSNHWSRSEKGSCPLLMV
jgi:hypothetical protein